MCVWGVCVLEPPGAGSQPAAWAVTGAPAGPSVQCSEFRSRKPDPAGCAGGVQAPPGREVAQRVRQDPQKAGPDKEVPQQAVGSGGGCGCSRAGLRCLRATKSPPWPAPAAPAELRRGPPRRPASSLRRVQDSSWGFWGETQRAVGEGKRCRNTICANFFLKVFFLNLNTFKATNK